MVNKKNDYVADMFFFFLVSLMNRSIGVEANCDLARINV